MVPTSAAGNMQTEPNREREREGEKGRLRSGLTYPKQMNSERLIQ